MTRNALERSSRTFPSGNYAAQSASRQRWKVLTTFHMQDSFFENNVRQLGHGHGLRTEFTFVFRVIYTPDRWEVLVEPPQKYVMRFPDLLECSNPLINSIVHCSFRNYNPFMVRNFVCIAIIQTAPLQYQRGRNVHGLPLKARSHIDHVAQRKLVGGLSS